MRILLLPLTHSVPRRSLAESRRLTAQQAGGPLYKYVRIRHHKRQANLRNPMAHTQCDDKPLAEFHGCAPLLGPLQSSWPAIWETLISRRGDLSQVGEGGRGRGGPRMRKGAVCRARCPVGCGATPRRRDPESSRSSDGACLPRSRAWPFCAAQTPQTPPVTRNVGGLCAVVQPGNPTQHNAQHLACAGRRRAQPIAPALRCMRVGLVPPPQNCAMSLPRMPHGEPAAADPMVQIHAGRRWIRPLTGEPAVTAPLQCFQIIPFLSLVIYLAHVRFIPRL
jgi:hypothetical protein